MVIASGSFEWELEWEWKGEMGKGSWIKIKIKIKIWMLDIRCDLLDNSIYYVAVYVGQAIVSPSEAVR